MSKHKNEPRKPNRQEKRAAIREQAFATRAERFARASGALECWMSQEFRRFGYSHVQCLKQGRRLAVSFLVHRGIVGLRSVWISELSIDEWKDLASGRGDDLGARTARVDPGNAQQLVAGGIRWAHECGMPLPVDWEAAVDAIGGVGDWKSADVSQFVKELISVPQHLCRPDDDVDEMNSFGNPPEMKQITERLTSLASGLTQSTFDWLTQRGQVPSPALLSAWQSVLLGIAVSKMVQPNASMEDRFRFTMIMVEKAAMDLKGTEFYNFNHAVPQVLDFKQTDPGMMRRIADQIEK